MKKAFIYIVLLSVALISCNKDAYLTRNDPTSTTDAKWWKTQGELENALNQIYAWLPQMGYWGNPNTRIFFAALTDNAYWNGNFYGSLNTMATGNGSSSIGWPCSGVWGNDYGEIRLATRFLKYAGNAYMDVDLKQRYIYEARALRAWYTLELWMYFRNIPLVNSVVTPDEAPKLTNSSQQDIGKFIISELDTCAANLPVSYSTDQAWRITKGACLAMKAVYYLNAKDYSNAAAAAKAVMDLKDANGNPVYQLYYSSDPSVTNYASLFSYSGEINNERIFINNHPNDTWFRNGPSGITPGPQQAALNPTASLVNAYENAQGKALSDMSPDSIKYYEMHPGFNRDPRFYATILYNGEVYAGDSLQAFTSDLNNSDRIGSPTGSQTGFWDRKYLDLVDRGNSYAGGTMPFMVIRYAQILLIRVEALVEGNQWQDPDVIKCLNEIRERAGMPDVNISEYNSQDKLRELYRRERRVELALEGWRWVDIRRWGIGNTVMNGPVYGAINPTTGQPVVVQTRSYNPSRDDLWPIPLNEINTSKIVQNPGW